MTTDPAPVLLLKSGCPHCLKVRLFLLEAGLLDRVEMREFVPGAPEEAPIRQELTGRVDKVTFPAVRLPDGGYMTESDAIVARLAALFGVDPAGLPVFATYAGTILPRYSEARRQLRELTRPA